jgi:hypothetical protein
LCEAAATTTTAATVVVVVVVVVGVGVEVAMKRESKEWLLTNTARSLLWLYSFP